MTVSSPSAIRDLEETARRSSAEEKAAEAIQKARVKLVIGHDAKSAFFATLALKMRLEHDWSGPTAATDGRTIIYNPDFVNGLKAKEVVGLNVHEVMHCALKHHTRRGNREPRKWNVACDLALNRIIRDAGFSLPPGALFPGEGEYADLPVGLSAEEYYSRLPDEPDAGDSCDGQGEDPGQCGAVRDAGDPSQQRQSEAEWEVSVAQASQVAAKRGNLPAGLDQFVETVTNPTINWKDALREFVRSTARNDYSWMPPNRRFVHMGLYLPSLRSEEIGDIVVTVDVSGSCCDPETLGTFQNELQGILEAYDCSLTVLYHDTEVHRVQHWQPSDGPLVLEPSGGGGTSHRCVFDWVASEGVCPECMVCLTDLYTKFPSGPPEYPVLWAVVGGYQGNPPFGRRVEVN